MKVAAPAVDALAASKADNKSVAPTLRNTALEFIIKAPCEDRLRTAPDHGERGPRRSVNIVWRHHDP
ncbi:MAG TPA: hypothetical protein VHT91_48175 [Kofleriaceae bacterium]|nr:hypothetical protein [Kofleriaceae bacterium]